MAVYASGGGLPQGRCPRADGTAPPRTATVAWCEGNTTGGGAVWAGGGRGTSPGATTPAALRWLAVVATGGRGHGRTRNFWAVLMAANAAAAMAALSAAAAPRPGSAGPAAGGAAGKPPLPLPSPPPLPPLPTKPPAPPTAAPPLTPRPPSPPPLPPLPPPIPPLCPRATAHAARKRTTFPPGPERVKRPENPQLIHPPSPWLTNVPSRNTQIPYRTPSYISSEKL